ncbi:MAG: hypothetical protein AUJ56_02330 [Zetaproteobacteria bacterium CG1_02_49_23]|nr:MAG: hypothetical protein AUJ56_02330 [Zetaproteobacteria bacterium CG1_02_49_23]
MLLLKRPEDVHCGGMWSLPGGKVGNMEMPLQAAIRELAEEAGLKGKRWRHLGKADYTYEDRRLHFLLFVCVCSDVSELQAESPCVWVSLDALNEYPMPQANEKIMPMLHLPELFSYLDELFAESLAE